MHITLIAGARPNFMKIAALIHAIQAAQKQGNAGVSHRPKGRALHYGYANRQHRARQAVGRPDEKRDKSVHRRHHRVIFRSGDRGADSKILGDVRDKPQPARLRLLPLS